MKHPTPAEIRLAISEALFADQQQHKDDPNVREIPVRTLSIINRAISQECDRAQGRNS